MGHQPDIYALSPQLRTYGELGHIDKMEKIWQYMRANNIAISEPAFFGVLKGYTTAQDIEKVNHIVSIMKSTLRPFRTWMSAVIEAYAACKRYDLAEKTYKDMIAANIAPDQGVFLGMIRAAGETNHADEIDYWWKEMTTRFSITPREFAYRALINANMRCKRLPQAVRAYEQLIQTNPTPNILIMKSILNAFIENFPDHPKLSEAKELLGLAESNHPDHLVSTNQFFRKLATSLFSTA